MNERLATFFNFIQESIYPEPPSEPHLTITRQSIESLIDINILKKGMRILDIGCGQGLALEIFCDKGFEATGITLGEDFNICLAKGFKVFQVDQNHMSFPEKSFDFIWARHVLEHSPIPLFTLFEYRRLLANNGIAYVEVPAPNTSAHHELNQNHYSVFTPTAWIGLFHKAGFHAIDSWNQIQFTLPSGGEDCYYNFFLERGQDA